MSQHVVLCRININGLHVKRCGTYSEGHTFPVDAVPEALFKKAAAGDQALDRKNKMVDIVSWMTPQGQWIRTKDAYIPRFDWGKEPAPMLSDQELSKKKRKAEALAAKGDEDSPSSEVSTEEDAPKKKKKKLKLKGSIVKKAS